MENLVRLAHLSEDDLICLPERVAENLAIAFDSVVNEANEAKKKMEQMTMDQETKLKAVSEKYSRLRSEFELADTNLSSLREALIKEEKKSHELSVDRDKLAQKLNDSQSVTNELELAIHRLENDKESLSELLSKKNEDYKRIKEELNEIQAEIGSIRKMKSEVNTQREEIETAKNILAIREKRLEETSASIKQQNVWYEEELHKANDKLLSIRSEYTENFLKLESELSSKKKELECSKDAVSKLENMVKILSESNEDHIDKLKLRTEELSTLEQMHAGELDAQRRLTELYKEKSSDFEKKCDELQRAVSELRELLQQGHDHVVVLQSEKKSIIEAFNEEKESLVAANISMANELKSAKEIVDKFRVNGLSQEELLQINPTIASTLASIKSGRSLIDIYAEYLQVVEERDRLKVDKDLLDAHIRELVEQLEEKAPILRSQQETFKKSKERVTELERQLEALQQSAKERDEHLDYQNRRAGYFQRQTLRLKETCKDLSVQVKTLLYELETARGTVISSMPMDEGNVSIPPDSSTDDIDSRDLLNVCSAAASVIDKNLVTFKSISDLQTQNARLLLVARDLASQLETHESNKESLDNHVSEITAKVDALSSEVEVARLSASEARSEAKLACRQRDMYKHLLQRHAIPLPDLSHPDETVLSVQDYEEETREKSIVSNDCDQTTASQNQHSQTVAKLEQLLCSLHAEFKQYREDKAKSDAVYTATIEKLRKEATENKISIQKLASELDFTYEKFRTQKANVENYKREISLLREMNASYTTSAAASDEALSSTRQEAVRLSDRLTESEVQCRQLIRQVEQLKANGDRLSRELEMERKTSLMHQKLMNQLESIQASLEHRNEIESRQAARRIESLEAQLDEVKKDASEKQDKLFSLNATLQAELTNVHQSLRSAEEEISQLRETAKPTGTSQSCSDVPAPHSPSLSTAGGQDQIMPLDEGDRPLLVRFRALERECASLRTSLEAARKQCIEYQSLGNEMESHIRQLTEEREQANRTHATDFEDAIQRCESLILQLELERSEREDLIKEKVRIEGEFAASLKALQERLAFTQTSLESAEERREAALAVEVAARAEVAAHLRTAKEAREKYEMELRLHSQDVELLMEARRLADKAQGEVESLRIALDTANASLNKAQNQLTEQSNSLEDSRSRLLKRVEDADAEISRLQEQILKLTEQIVNLRKLLEHSSEQSVHLDESTTQIKESEDFVHLLEYLRRQKSIAEAAEESANAEVNRLHLRTKTLESQLADLQAKLAEERQKNETRLVTSSQYATLMKQVEQVNLLSESNRLLRQEREMIRKNASEFQEELAALRDEIAPLRAKCADLEDMKVILTSEKSSLDEEKNRWKERCERLVETSRRLDPEEFKQACEARDDLQARVNALEESKALADREAAAKIACLEQQVTELSSDLNRHQTNSQDLANKLSILEEKCTQQENELSQRQVKITKLREIGRKYRQEAEELKRRTTQLNEESRKTSEEGVVAIRADLLAAQANLSSEQDRSNQLRQEIEQLQLLIHQVESLPETEFVKQALVSDSQLISTNAPSSSEIFNRLNRLLSVLISRIGQMREKTEEQDERLLRMNLIESQLMKTKQYCSELRTKLASFIDKETSITLPPTESSSQQQSESPDTSSKIKAAVAVQPVQTPPTASETSPLSLSAARQTAEIRPLSSCVATVLPTTTTAIESLPSSSYLAPLTTTSEGGPSTSMFVANRPSVITTAKRTYEEALMSEEGAAFTSSQLEQKTIESKRLRPASTPSVQEQQQQLSTTLFSPLLTSTIPPSGVFNVKSDTLPPVAATVHEEEVPSFQDSVVEEEEEHKESDDVEMDEQSALTFDEEEGDDAMREYAQEKDQEAERSDDVGLVIDSSRDADHSQQEEEEDPAEEGEERPSDYDEYIVEEGEQDDEYNEEKREDQDDDQREVVDVEEEYEGDYQRQDSSEDEEQEDDKCKGEGGVCNPVIVVSSSEEEDGNDEEEVDDGEEGEQTEDSEAVEEEEEEEGHEQHGKKSGELAEESPQDNQKSEDEKSQSPPRPSSSIFTSSAPNSGGLFGSALAESSAAPSGGLFSIFKAAPTTKPIPLFGGFGSSATSSTAPSFGSLAGDPSPTFLSASKPSKENTGSAEASKQKIRPIVWTESSSTEAAAGPSRKHSAPGSSAGPSTTISGGGLLRGTFTQASGLLGVARRKGNWGGPFGSGAPRGAPRGGHR
nr:nucleoprotein TPR [Hymenolepis microstoma]